MLEKEETKSLFSADAISRARNRRIGEPSSAPPLKPQGFSLPTPIDLVGAVIIRLLLLPLLSSRRRPVLGPPLVLPSGDRIQDGDLSEELFR